jgi:hypothetical protein
VIVFKSFGGLYGSSSRVVLACAGGDTFFGESIAVTIDKLDISLNELSIFFN